MRMIAIILALLLACGCSEKSTAGKDALLASFIRLDAEITQGTSVSDFSHDVLDARTKFEIAKSDLNSETQAAVESGLVAAEATKSIWNALSVGKRPDLPGKPDSLFSQMLALGIVANESDYVMRAAMMDAVLDGTTYDPQFTSGATIKLALQKCGPKIHAVVEALKR
jgi:hypothetical protein